MKKKLTRALAAILISAQAGAAGAADDGFQMFEEEAKIVAASRREQAVSESPLAVDVVTQEEIKASGAVNVWDLLRFRVGLDVLEGRSIDGNRAIVSGRGFPHEFAGNILVLVDGRGVYSVNQGGVYWEQLPVQLQDIERIEIVRGPSAALYGTGAGVGVINIVTKKPSSEASLAADTRAGSGGLIQAYQSAEGAFLKKASVRVSHTFQSRDGFPKSDAAAAAADDSMRKNVVDVRAAVPLSERANLDLFAGGSWSAVGLASGHPGERADFADHFQMAKLTYALSGDSSVEAMTARNDFQSNSAQTGLAQDSRQIQYDAELLHRVAWLGRRLNTTYGMSYRNVQLNTPYMYGARRPYLQIVRGFAQQSAQLTERLSLQGAVAVESSNESGVYPNYQAAGVYALAPGHAARASYSVAHTLRDFVPVYGDFKPDATTRIIGNEQAGAPYRITSYETGYYGAWLHGRLQTDASVFYTRIDNFHQIFFDSFSFPTTTLKFQLYDAAVARGGELKLKYRFSKSRWVYANYTYEIVTDNAGDAGLATRNTPTHKFNLGGRTALARGWSASADLGYKDAYFIQAVGGGAATSISAYWRLDAKLAYRPDAWPDAEFYLAGQNLLAERHNEFADSLSVPRTVQAGVSVKLFR